MSRIVKLTPEIMDEVCKSFKEVLKTSKLTDGKISFSKTFNNIDRKATLYFTETAWIKMQTLIREFDKEVAWHGVAKRGEDLSKDEYIIRDILVYPQEVTGATVNTDQSKYQSWLYSFDDEVFNNIRMQGHSHVNMSTSPSGVDLTHQSAILEGLDDDMFYIFLIWNKRNEKSIKIYDLKKNVLFETSDVKVKIMDDGTGIAKFIKEAKDMVEEKTYYKTNYTSPTTQYYGGGCYYTTNYKNENKKNDEPVLKLKDKNESNQKEGKQNFPKVKKGHRKVHINAKDSLNELSNYISSSK